MSITTELEAVNMMLKAIGQTPVSSLDVPGVQDVATARSTLTEVSRKVQGPGLRWNSEADLPATRDVNGRVAVPSRALSIRGSKSAVARGLDIVQRGGFLYDLARHTNVFTEDFTIDVVWFLDFADLPEPVAQHVAARAARQYAGDTLGETNILQEVLAEESRTLREMNRFNTRTSGANMLNGSWSVSNILRRR